MEKLKTIKAGGKTILLNPSHYVVICDDVLFSDWGCAEGKQCKRVILSPENSNATLYKMRGIAKSEGLKNIKNVQLKTALRYENKKGYILTFTNGYHTADVPSYKGVENV